MVHRIKHLLFLFAFLCFGSSYAFAQDPLVFASVNDFPPYAYLENGKLTGIDVDVINELARRGGLKIKIEPYPWKRILHYTKHGIVDGAFAAFKNPERETFAYFVGPPLHKSVYKIFVKKEKVFEFNRIQDLYGKRIGKNMGFHINREFEQAEMDKKIVVLEASLKLNIKRLFHDRIDGVVGNMAEVWRIFHELNLFDKIVALPKPVRGPTGAYLIISKALKKTDKDLFIQNIRNTLKAMEDDGTIDRINSSYLQKKGY